MKHKNYLNVLKCLTLTFVGSSAGWMYYQIKKTQKALEGAVDTSVLKVKGTFVQQEESHVEEYVDVETFYPYERSSIWKNMWDSLKFAYARRLVRLANSDNKSFRIKAVKQLAKVKHLDNWHCALLANMIDPRIAVGLARSGDVDKLCMENLSTLVWDIFLSKVFVYEHDNSHIVDHDSSTLELSKFILSESDILPKCLESLLHHCSLEKYTKDVVDLNGLPLLMEIQDRYKSDIHITIKLSQIISFLSFNRSLLQPMHKSGWIGVLSEWINHEDIRVSVPAARALANLDIDNTSKYSRQLYLLHPVTRTVEDHKVDIVFIHGLLGGVFYTWRQRNKGPNIMRLLSKKKQRKDSVLPQVDIEVDELEVEKTTKSFFRSLREQIDVEDVHKDFEVVWDDIPIKTNVTAEGPYTGSGKNCLPKQEKTCYYTQCWPKDWLSEDCPNLRIIGINYDTSLSMWAPICPSEKSKLTLDERSDDLLTKLLQTGLGKKPIVWITHSMGGLIVKNMLCKAFESENAEVKNVCLNTKGIVFYSTPHNGSRIANLSHATALLLWPSVEVQELRQKIVKAVPMRIITFVETKSTVVTAMKLNFLLVEPESGNPGVGEYYEIPQDHLGICKPLTKYSFLYQKVLWMLKQIVDEDISSFSSDDFDTKVWINDILKTSENQKEANYTMSLVMKLQLYVQQVNNALEDTSQQVLASLPKIMRDTKNLQQEALALKEKMAIVRQEIEKIEHDTGKSINTIEKLDSMKSRLNMAKQGLHESDNWMILVNDLEEVFDSKNIENISNKILGMQNSLKLLINVADYEDRKLQLDGLKNRLEAIASPSIVQSFNSNNTEQSQMFVKIFASIGRLPQLLKYYHKCQKDILLKKWRNQLEIEQDETAIQWIHNYYNVLLSNWHTQYRWFNQVFTSESAHNVLIDVYVDVLTSLDPSLNECIDAALKQVSEKLPFLYDVKQTTKQFGDNLVQVIEQTAQGKVDTDRIIALLKAAYSHMVLYINRYAAYEQATLMKQLTTLNCMKDELPDTIQALGLSIPSVIDIAREAKKRCHQITENCGYCGLLIALRAFLLGYADFYRVALRQLGRNKRTEEDWSTFQLCLSLLQNTGEVLLKLQHLEKDLTNAVLELNQKETLIEYKYLLLNPADLKEFESLVKCVTEGTQLSLLDHVTTEFNRLCAEIHNTTYQVVFAPISKHLEVVQSPQTWAQYTNSTLHNSDLPDYSFTPQEYITQIGQYLMTLPQHLEPFLFRDNPSLACALKAVDIEYNNAADGEDALASVFLKVVARGTCQVFCERIMSICELSQPASRQLAHDINYLNNILEELGMSLTENLQQLSLLLKIPSDQYQAQSTGCSARYVAAIRQMRNIKSSN
ncbi:hypothetical protein NQ318_014675 [Aromia moschata]|uniref:Conserved oligomeric Golgi complex subunit 7 n=1 Tax=Aromia moschata TaxID=1265417 RepID=A0AAV8ZCV5_9CUCU|nr:hypothetical protein NQ318_014675 [Aromia moschata]